MVVTMIYFTYIFLVNFQIHIRLVMVPSKIFQPVHWNMKKILHTMQMQGWRGHWGVWMHVLAVQASSCLSAVLGVLRKAKCWKQCLPINRRCLQWMRCCFAASFHLGIQHVSVANVVTKVQDVALFVIICQIYSNIKKIKSSRKWYDWIT